MMRRDNLRFTLTRAQRREFEAWLDRQAEQAPVEIFTVAFTVTPQGVQVRAYVDEPSSVKECTEVLADSEGRSIGDCYLQLAEDQMFNLTPVGRLGQVQMMASSEGIYFNRGDELRVGPCWAYAMRVDDPLMTLVPIVVTDDREAFGRHSRPGHPLDPHPLSLYRAEQRVLEDVWGDVSDFVRRHKNALEDHWAGKIDSVELWDRLAAVKAAVPDGVQQPLSADDWAHIEQLDACLLDAERFVRAEKLKFDAECARRVTERSGPEDVLRAPDWLSDADFDIALTCWLREDDPDWREDEDNIVYENDRSLIFHEDWPLEEDWNTFRSWVRDPLEGRPCSYFMHDLIDHGHLNTRDLLRIGAIWINVNRVLQREIFVEAVTPR